MSNIIKFFLDLQVQLKLYHWQTTSYSRHIATDKLYEKITDLSDKFIEVYFGKYGRQKAMKEDKQKQQNVPVLNKKHERCVCVIYRC
jgi:hypothetical protein